MSNADDFWDFHDDYNALEGDTPNSGGGCLGSLGCLGQLLVALFIIIALVKLF